MKRVLLTTFPSAFLHQGGGEREILLLNEALNNAGVMSDIYGPMSKSINSYEALIHFSMAGGSEYIVDDAFRSDLKRILWPNLWFVSEPSLEHLHYLSNFLSRFDAVVFRSHSEERHFSKYLDTAGKEIIRVSPLISQRFFSAYNSDVFRESYGLERYAIWPGIIEPQKNQLAAVRAFKGLPLNLVISGAVRDASYLQQCAMEADKNVLFIPAMPFGSELHLSALRNSLLFVELPLDFPGSSALEASLLGCTLLLSRTEWTDEFLRDRCSQVDPSDVPAIRAAIQSCTDMKADGFSSMQMRETYPSLAAAIKPLLTYLAN